MRVKIEQNLKNLNEKSTQLIDTTGVRLHHRTILDMVSGYGIKVYDSVVFSTGIN